ncbi:type IV secretory system conjugative DNA transfer family protein [Robertkochia sp. 1368]|nr:type IV secretory system conjugative DNA transfer family protein [Robertkochia sediminum]
MIQALILGWFSINPSNRKKHDHPYSVSLKGENSTWMIDNLRKGISIIGAAGSGKTESLIHPLMMHLASHNFSGVIYDYKNFELTELAYPIFKTNDLPFYIISFDRFYNRVNPIAPKYMRDEESVNEFSRVLIENLMELKESGAEGSSKFFQDAAEGLLAGLIWMFKQKEPDACNLPALIDFFIANRSEQLAECINQDCIARGMASAFLNGLESERQTAGVLSTLANGLKKINTQRIRKVISKDEVPLECNHASNPGVICLVNNPKFESAYSPILSAILHVITKQMSERNRRPSFLLMEEAPTLRLLNMHRIPATLRSYNIATLYVLQDKVQNDVLYGEKMSRAILANLSYQFFGKANDPETGKYYEQFLELIKTKTRSVSKGMNLSFDTRITSSEKEVHRIRANQFFKLQTGQFIASSDARSQLLTFPKKNLHRSLPILKKEDLFWKD